MSSSRGPRPSRWSSGPSSSCLHRAPASDCSLWPCALALDGGGDGLRVIRRIVTSAREVLRPSAPLLLETAGGSQAGAVAGLLRAAGFTGVGVRADLAGVDRFVAGRA